MFITLFNVVDLNTEIITKLTDVSPQDLAKSQSREIQV